MMAARTDIYSEMIDRFNLKVNEPMGRYTTFKIGGPADLLAMPQTIDELKELLETANQLDLAIHIFGGGTNILVSDKGIRGLVILTRRLTSGRQIIRRSDTEAVVFCPAGEKLAGLCRFAIENHLSGLEFAAGIPGTVGGAIKMNAGTPDGRICDLIASIEALDTGSLEIKTLEKTKLAFSYRHLDLDGLILSANFRLHPSDEKTIRTAVTKVMHKKQSSQPVSKASAGCFFKNPADGDPAGKLIEMAGLKGKKINDAMVSDLHANYIINTGHASFRDVMALKDEIQRTVFNKFGIKLETEVRIQGES